MPEDPEIQTDDLQEAIRRELDGESGALMRRIALTTAILAALAAIAALRAGATVNEALILKTEATRLQAEASDQWAYYQAKGVKQAVQEASKSSWRAIGKEPPAAFAAEQARYVAEQTDIQKKARELERQRDERSAEADHLFRRHHGFANDVAIFQIAIALGAVAALTRLRLVWYGSLALGVAGIIVFVVSVLR